MTTETSNPPVYTASEAEVPRTVTLNVGGRQYTTLKATLASESAFFEALLSDRWGGAQSDGSYFVDADPDLFEHIIRYLRRGTYPFLYNPTTGFDVHTYTQIQREAEYFQIEKLAEWIRNGGYKAGVSSKFRSGLVLNGESMFSSKPNVYNSLDDVTAQANKAGLVDVKVEVIYQRDMTGVRGFMVSGRSISVKPEVFKA